MKDAEKIGLLRELSEAQAKLNHLAFNIIVRLPDKTSGKGKFLVEYSEVLSMLENNFNPEVINPCSTG